MASAARFPVYQIDFTAVAAGKRVAVIGDGEAAIDLAENWLNVSRIELEVFTDNAAGLALYEKFDFSDKK